MTNISQSKYVGYHTCKLINGYEYIVKNIPFKSGSGSNQWLTQGFYFWTDSAHWAKKWGVKNSRVIGKFHISLCRETELFDLVGNVRHQEELISFKDEFFKHLPQDKLNNITVHQIIKKLRSLDERIFPYLAIKAEDKRCEQNINFVDPRINRSKIDLITPQQMCVFEKGINRIVLDTFIEPDEYTLKIKEKVLE